jgi:hypothetical protein
MMLIATLSWRAAGSTERSALEMAGTSPSFTKTSETVNAGPDDYLAKLRALTPGQTLLLAPGDYEPRNDVPGLPIFDLHGTPEAPITITGPERGPRPVLLGQSTHNTVRFANASYIVVRNLDIDGRNLGGDGVKAQGVAHHITLENLAIRGVESSQDIVGISTSGGPTWNWVIRGNTIINAGTGMYLGSSDGRRPFVAGIIERNLVQDSIGYNIQIKHQLPWTEVSEQAVDGSTTVIRHNVLTKNRNSSTGRRARPSVLIGDVPAFGPGSAHGYEIYGNFFFQNPSEALFQGEGNIALYSNLFVNDFGDAVNIRRHNGTVRTVHVFGNTVVAAGSGISIKHGDIAYRQIAAANAVFSAGPVEASHGAANIFDSYANAARHLANPKAPIGRLDLFPRPNALWGKGQDMTGFSGHPDWDLDFNSRKRDWRRFGAYSTGTGANPGWTPQIGRKVN